MGAANPKKNKKYTVVEDRNRSWLMKTSQIRKASVWFGVSQERKESRNELIDQLFDCNRGSHENLICSTFIS